MKAKEVLDTLKISRRTLTRYIKNNIIKATRLPTGQYIYDDESVYKLASTKTFNKTKSCIIIYIINKE